MKTPFTDANTLVMHVDGKSFPVTPLPVAQMLEVRCASLVLSQDIAWGLIKLTDWNHQPKSWREAAHKWQTDTYVQKELPLNFTPGHKIVDDDRMPANLPEALRMLAILRHERATEAIRLAQLEKHLETLEEIVSTLESKNHDLTNIAQSIQRN